MDPRDIRMGAIPQEEVSSHFFLTRQINTFLINTKTLLQGPPRKRQRQSRDYEGHSSPPAAQEGEHTVWDWVQGSANPDVKPLMPRPFATSKDGIADLLAKWTTVQRPDYLPSETSHRR